MTQDLTTLICLFHHRDQARAALEDILKADVPESNVTLIGGAGSNIESSRTSLAELNVPEHDLVHLHDGLKAGGLVLTVSAISSHVEAVEEIFSRHKAGKIDEAMVKDDMSAQTLPAGLGDGRAIPIIEEDLQVGKRTVDAGGVRVHRQIIEVPVEESVTLREEHISVTRQAVDRPVERADLLHGNQVIVLTETAEEVVIGKSAHVIEEVLIGKKINRSH